MKLKIMAIDPSINNCGVAIFNNKVLEDYSLIKSETKVKQWEFKAESVYQKVLRVHKHCKIRLMILEIPEYWRGSVGFCARESGTIWKLMFLCGMLATISKTIYVTPSKWKGQLSKDIVKNRLQEFYKNKISFKRMNHNVVDAIGIGHWYIYEEKKSESL